MLQTEPIQYPNLPSLTVQYQVSYNPVHQFQPVQYPDFNQNQHPDFNQPQFHAQPELQHAPSVHPEAVLKFQHLNARCTLHQYPMNLVCQSPVCNKRLLCGLCAEEHGKNYSGHKGSITALQDLLDDSIIAQLDNLIREEQYSKYPHGDKCEKAMSDIHFTFEGLKLNVIELLNQAEEQAKEKAKEFFMSKQGRGWDHIRREYLNKKDIFLQSNPGVQTLELVQLIDIVNKIKAQQFELENDLLEALRAQKNQADKFLMRLKENIGLITDNLFADKNKDSQALPVKIDPNYIYYNTESKGDHKLLLNAVTCIPKYDQLVTANEAGVISLWNSTTFGHLGSYKVHNDAVNALLYVESEGILVSASKDKSIRLIPVREEGLHIKKIEVFRSHSAPVKSLVLLEGEDRFASGGEEPDIRVWNFKTRNLDNIINTKGWKVTGDEMAFIRPERWIVAAGTKKIRIYDYVTRELLITQSVVKMMGSLAFLSEKRLLVAQDDNDRIMVWKVDGEKKKLKTEKKIKLKNKVKGQAYFKCFEDSDMMLVSMRSNKVGVYKLSTGAFLKDIETKLNNTTGMTVLKNERRIVVGDSGSNNLGVLQY